MPHAFEGSDLTYYNLLTGDWSAGSPDCFLYEIAHKYFMKQREIYREIIDGMGEDCDIIFIDEYLAITHAIITYEARR